MHLFADQLGELGVVHGFGQQSAEDVAMRCGQSDAELTQCGDDVGAKSAGVGHVDVGESMDDAGVDDEFGTAGPPAVQGGFARAGPSGYALHRQSRVADVGQFIEGCRQDGVLQFLASAARVSSMVAVHPVRRVPVGWRHDSQPFVEHPLQALSGPA